MTGQSLLNYLAARSHQPEPEVGMGVTILMWSDRHPGTITGVERAKSGPLEGHVTRIWVRPVEAVVDVESAAYKAGWRPGNSEFYAYRYVEHEEWPSTPWTLRSNGRWCRQGQPSNSEALSIGSRAEYLDPSF